MLPPPVYGSNNFSTLVQHSILTNIFFIFASLMGEKWYLTAVSFFHFSYSEWEWELRCVEGCFLKEKNLRYNLVNWLLTIQYYQFIESNIIPVLQLFLPKAISSTCAQDAILSQLLSDIAPAILPILPSLLRNRESLAFAHRCLPVPVPSSTGAYTSSLKQNKIKIFPDPTSSSSRFHLIFLFSLQQNSKEVSILTIFFSFLKIAFWTL